MADYAGSFNGSFQGTISGSLLGSGIVSGSTQIDFNSIVNKPTTIQPFQANSITSNNQFRQVTYPAISASTSTRFTTIESSVSTLSGQVQAAVSGTVPPGTISGSTQIAALGYLTSASAVAAGFGSGGGTTTDISALNTFTSSAQTSLTALNSATSSYLTSTNTGSFILVSQTSSMSVLSALTASVIGNLNYNFITNLPNLISSSTQIALLGAGLLSSSAQIASQISGSFTSLSASFAARLDSLNVGGGIFQLTGSSYNTTNNIQITGSLSVGSGSFKSFEVNSDGFVVLGDMDKDLNTAPIGTVVYSGSNFYLIS